MRSLLIAVALGAASAEEKWTHLHTWLSPEDSQLTKDTQFRAKPPADDDDPVTIPWKIRASGPVGRNYEFRIEMYRSQGGWDDETNSVIINPDLDALIATKILKGVVPSTPIIFDVGGDGDCAWCDCPEYPDDCECAIDDVASTCQSGSGQAPNMKLPDVAPGGGSWETYFKDDELEKGIHIYAVTTNLEDGVFLENRDAGDGWQPERREILLYYDDFLPTGAPTVPPTATRAPTDAWLAADNYFQQTPAQLPYGVVGGVAYTHVYYTGDATGEAPRLNNLRVVDALNEGDDYERFLPDDVKCVAANELDVEGADAQTIHGCVVTWEVTQGDYDFARSARRLGDAPAAGDARARRLETLDDYEAEATPPALRLMFKETRRFKADFATANFGVATRYAANLPTSSPTLAPTTSAPTAAGQKGKNAPTAYGDGVNLGLPDLCVPGGTCTFDVILPEEGLHVDLLVEAKRADGQPNVAKIGQPTWLLLAGHEARGRHLAVTWTVPEAGHHGIPEGQYRLRCIVWEMGVDVTSGKYDGAPSGGDTRGEFPVGFLKPTVAPTAEPTRDTLSLRVLSRDRDFGDTILTGSSKGQPVRRDTDLGRGGGLVPGERLTFELSYTGSDRDTNGAVVISLCRSTWGDDPIYGEDRRLGAVDGERLVDRRLRDNDASGSRLYKESSGSTDTFFVDETLKAADQCVDSPVWRAGDDDPDAQDARDCRWAGERYACETPGRYAEYPPGACYAYAGVLWADADWPTPHEHETTCACHATCASCGYVSEDGKAPSASYQCLSCKEGPLADADGDGVGTCGVPVEGAAATAAEACPLSCDPDCVYLLKHKQATDDCLGDARYALWKTAVDHHLAPPALKTYEVDKDFDDTMLYDVELPRDLPSGHAYYFVYADTVNKAANFDATGLVQKVTTTVSGLTCQKWTEQSPWTHVHTPGNYPDADLGDHNECRDPDGSGQAWCYTTSPAVRREFCDPDLTRKAWLDALYATDFFMVEDYAPTHAPTYRPTEAPINPPSAKPTLAPVFKPTPYPTYLPTKLCTIEFPNAEDFYWRAGSRVSFRVRVCDDHNDQKRGYSYDFGYGLLDVLLYKGSELYDVVVAYATMETGDKYYVDYDVPAALEPGHDYKLRAIEYTRGYDEESVTFPVNDNLDYEPSTSPTPAPSHTGLAMVLRKKDKGSQPGTLILTGPGAGFPNSVAPGEQVTLTLAFTGRSRDQNGLMVVQLCRGARDSTCAPAYPPDDSGRGTGAASNKIGFVKDVSVSKTAGTEKVVTFTIPEGIAPGDDYRFMARDRGAMYDTRPLYKGAEAGKFYEFVQVSDSFVVAYYAPTPHPSPQPTQRPTTPRPTAATVVFDPAPRSWIVGKRETVALKATGPRDRAVVDVLLYGCAVVTATPGPSACVSSGAPNTQATLLATVARYASFDGSRDFAYDVPWDLVAATAYKGFFLRVVEYARGVDVYSDDFSVGYTPQPSPEPSRASKAPTPRPTRRGLNVDVVAARELSPGDEAEVTFSYAGAHDGASVVTLGVCKKAHADESMASGGCAGDSAVVLEYGIDVAPGADTVKTVEIPAALVDGDRYVFYAVDVVNEYAVDTHAFKFRAVRPTPAPTLKPTAATLGFPDLPLHVKPGETLELAVAFYDDPELAPDESRMDCVLYKTEDLASTTAAYVAPVLVIGEYVEVTPKTTALAMRVAVPETLEQRRYAVRCVDTLRGLDVASGADIGVFDEEPKPSSAPTKAVKPTPRPTVEETVVVVQRDPQEPLAYGADDALVVGADVTLVVVAYGGDAHVVTVRMCVKKRLDSGRDFTAHLRDAADVECDAKKPIETLIVDASVGNTALDVPYTVPATFLGRDDVVFEISDATRRDVRFTDVFGVFEFAPSRKPVYAPSAAPTYGPTPKPTLHPAPAPTEAGLSLVARDPLLVKGARSSVRLRLVGPMARGDALVDVVVHDAALSATGTDALAVIAAGEAFDGSRSFDFDVAPDWPASVEVRAYDHVHGYAAVVELPVVDAYAPTPRPTDEPGATPRPTGDPTPSPTAPVLAVELLTEADEAPELGAGRVNAFVAGARAKLTMAYVGRLASVPAVASVRVCYRDRPRIAAYYDSLAENGLGECDGAVLLASAVKVPVGGASVYVALPPTPEGRLHASLRVDSAPDRSTFFELGADAPSDRDVVRDRLVYESMTFDVVADASELSLDPASTWLKKGTKADDCDWVALNTAERCVKHDEDGTLATEGCPNTCADYEPPAPTAAPSLPWPTPAPNTAPPTARPTPDPTPMPTLHMPTPAPVTEEVLVERACQADIDAWTACVEAAGVDLDALAANATDSAPAVEGGFPATETVTCEALQASEEWLAECVHPLEDADCGAEWEAATECEWNAIATDLLGDDCALSCVGAFAGAMPKSFNKSPRHALAARLRGQARL